MINSKKTFMLEFASENDVQIVIFKGSLDAITMHPHQKKIKGVMEDSQKIIFDLTEVKYLDSSTLGFLSVTWRMRTTRKRKMTFLFPKSQSVLSLLKTMSFDKVLPFYNTREEACKAMEEPPEKQVQK